MTLQGTRVYDTPERAPKNEEHQDPHTLAIQVDFALRVYQSIQCHHSRGLRRLVPYFLTIHASRPAALHYQGRMIFNNAA